MLVKVDAGLLDGPDLLEELLRECAATEEEKETFARTRGFGQGRLERDRLQNGADLELHLCFCVEKMMKWTSAASRLG